MQQNSEIIRYRREQGGANTGDSAIWGIQFVNSNSTINL